MAEGPISHEAAEHGQCGIVGICGSLRQGSYTRMALQIALDGAAEMGAHTRILDLGAYDLVFCDGRRKDEELPADVVRLRQDLRRARGILLGTPEYHGSFSGVLKNALDLMGFEEFEGKMVGLIGVSGGQMGGFLGLTELRSIGRALHAWVVPEQAAIAEAWKLFDASGGIKDQALGERLRGVGRQVARFSLLHAASASEEFIRLWEGAPPNPGGGARQTGAA
jgi:FMN reductase